MDHGWFYIVDYSWYHIYIYMVDSTSRSRRHGGVVSVVCPSGCEQWSCHPWNFSRIMYIAVSNPFIDGIPMLKWPSQLCFIALRGMISCTYIDTPCGKGLHNYGKITIVTGKINYFNGHFRWLSSFTRGYVWFNRTWDLVYLSIRMSSWLSALINLHHRSPFLHWPMEARWQDEVHGLERRNEISSIQSMSSKPHKNAEIINPTETMANEYTDASSIVFGG